jgi:integrase
VYGDRFTVRQVRHRDGRQSYWIFAPDGEVHRPSLSVLKGYGSSTQQTYAYSLVDHLNWMRVNNKGPDTLTLDELRRYMNGITGTDGIYGAAWRRPDQKPLGPSAAGNVATVVKAYYVALSASEDVSPELIEALQPTSVRDRRGRSHRLVDANPLAPRKSARRPRFLPDEVVEALFQPGVLTTARDIMIITWLHDGGIRVGGLCGLRFSDLHLIKHHPCGQREDPHIHIVGRDNNPNGARAKAYKSASVSNDGYVLDGVIRAVSADMVSTFYGYLLDDYHSIQHLVDHEQVLVHTQGRTPGVALTTGGVRKMLRRACRRAGLHAYVVPHAFRHKAAAAFYAATDFNAEMVAQEFGWASADIVTQLYGKSANRQSMRYLQQAWDATTRPPSQPQLGSRTPSADGAP